MLTVEEWNEIYEELQVELQQAIARQLIEDTKNDEVADFELN